MKNSITTATLALVATLSVGCSSPPVTRQTTVTKETTGYGPSGTEAEANVVTHSVTTQRLGLDSAPARSTSTTTVDRPDGTRSTVEEERRTDYGPDGTTTRKRTTTTTVE